MKKFALSVLMTAGIISAGCGATRRVSSTVAPGPSITSATIQFNDREHGKDAVAPMTLPMSGTFY